jgi:hypothetical protein
MSIYVVFVVTDKQKSQKGNEHVRSGRNFSQDKGKGM